MALVRRIESAPERSDWAAFEVETTHAISRKPLADLFAARGLVRVRLGRDDEALADFEQALRLAGDRHEWRRRRLDLFEKRGLWAELAADLDFIVALEPENLALRERRAKARIRCGEFSRAADDLALLIKRDPENDEFRLLRARAFNDAGQREQALADVTHVIAKRPSAELYALRGEFHWREKWIERATTDFEKAIELDGKHAGALAGLAEILLRTDAKQAAELAGRAAEAAPAMARAWFLRGYARLVIKDRDGAVGDFEKAWTLDESLKDVGTQLLSVPYARLVKELQDP
jgi:tetratricopeptide (TPR) repeat protein